MNNKRSEVLIEMIHACNKDLDDWRVAFGLCSDENFRFALCGGEPDNQTKKDVIQSLDSFIALSKEIHSMGVFYRRTYLDHKDWDNQEYREGWPEEKEKTNG